MRRWRLAAGIAAVTLLGGGCGKPVLREADPSIGDYYTKEEYDKLSREQREQYCEDLARQLEANEDQIAEAREALTSLRSGLPPLRADVDSLRDAEARLAERLATERSKPARAPEASRPADRYVVRPGDSLWRISGEPGVYGSGERWVRLYEANRGVIRDPNVIHPGQTIRIPR